MINKKSRNSILLVIVIIMSGASFCFAQQSPAADKGGLLRQFYNQQGEKTEAFLKEQYNEEKVFLKKILKNNTSLTDSEKDDLVEVFLTPAWQHEAEASYQENRIANVIYLVGVADDKSMTIAQKLAAVRNYMASRKW